MEYLLEELGGRADGDSVMLMVAAGEEAMIGGGEKVECNRAACHANPGLGTESCRKLPGVRSREPMTACCSSVDWPDAAPPSFAPSCLSPVLSAVPDLPSTPSL